MNNQELFNLGWNHFVVNKGLPSIRIIEEPFQLQCAYRGDNGTKCAIGLAIPDTIYSTEFEGKSAIGLCSPGSAFSEDMKELFKECDSLFLSLYQGCHDNSALSTKEGYLYQKVKNDPNTFLDRIEHLFRNLAEQFMLEIPNE